jgi:hypothetical protein
MALVADTFGCELLDCWESLYGRKILGVRITDRAVSLALDNGEVLQLSCAGRCRKVVYFSCDDSVAKIVGGQLRSIQLRPDRSQCVELGALPVRAFLEISTDECFITVRTHSDFQLTRAEFALQITRGQLH